MLLTFHAGFPIFESSSEYLCFSYVVFFLFVRKS